MHIDEATAHHQLPGLFLSTDIAAVDFAVAHGVSDFVGGDGMDQPSTSYPAARVRDPWLAIVDSFCTRSHGYLSSNLAGRRRPASGVSPNVGGRNARSASGLHTLWTLKTLP